MPRIFIYTRSSTNRQEISCKSQEEIIHKYIEHRRSTDWADYEIAGVFQDQGISASIPLIKRDQGHRMLLNAKKGDVIVASHLSRVFRNTGECVQFLDEIVKTGVDFVVLDANFDTSTPVGLACLKIMAVFAELERAQIRERICNAMAWKRANGLPTSGKAPMGWIVVGKGKTARLEPCMEDRDVCKYVAFLHYTHKFTHEEIYQFLRKKNITLSSSKEPKPTTVGRMLVTWRYFVTFGEWCKEGCEYANDALKRVDQPLSREDLESLSYQHAPIPKSSDQ